MNILNKQNATYSAADNSLVDLEINTSEHGLIPITINLLDNDQEPHIIELKTWITNNAALISPYINPTVAPTYKTRFSSNDYLDKFTVAQQESIATLSMSNVTAKLWYDRMLAADFIDITDPKTIGGLDFAISVGIIDAAKKAEILTPQLIV